MSRHGVFILEESTAMTVPVTGNSAVQVVIGTAPVNMVDNPEDVVNVPILANSAAEAIAALGFCKDFQNYTLCQTMYVTSNIYTVSPVVYINVLDPTKHKSAFAEKSANVESMTAKFNVIGIIRDSDLTIAANDTVLEKNSDYTLGYDSDGYLIVNLIAGGAGASATEVKIHGNVLDPSKVTASDIIGAYDTTTGEETGMEVIRKVYPKLGVVPGLLLAPGWSQIPEVGIALAAKAVNINGVFNAMALLDLDTTTARKYTDCRETKNNNGFTSEFCYPLWPCAKVGNFIFAMSTMVGALISYTDASNDDVPSVSPSNKMLGITGTCLADGTEILLDLDQGGTVNTYGVATAINMNGWRLWGNYTGAYPPSGDTENVRAYQPSGDTKDIWFPVRRMFNWHGNMFVQTYLNKVDDPMNKVLVESVVDSENIRCASYAPDKWAGASIEYLASDNPTEDILDGKMTFRQHIAPYTPAQEIDNILNYDTAMLIAALTGGE